MRTILVVDVHNIYSNPKTKHLDYVDLLTQVNPFRKIAYMKAHDPSSGDFYALLERNGYELRFGDHVSMALELPDLKCDHIVMVSSAPQVGRILWHLKEKGFWITVMGVDVNNNYHRDFHVEEISVPEQLPTE